MTNTTADTLTPELRQRTAVFNLYMVIAVVYCLIFGPAFLYYLHITWLGWLHIGLIPVLLGTTWYNKSHNAIIQCENILQIICVVMITSLSVSGGAWGSGLLLAMVGVVFMFFLGNRRLGLMWSVVALVLIICGWFIGVLRGARPPYSGLYFIMFVFSYSLMMLLQYIYGGQKDKLHRVITRQVDELKDLLAQSHNLQQELAVEKASVEQKVIERTEQLHEEQTKLKASIESLDIGFVMLDNNNQVVQTNKAINTIMDDQPEQWTLEALGAHFTQTADSESPIEVFNRVRSQGKSEYFNKVSIGNKIARLFIAPISYKDQILGIVVLIEDITEQEIIARSKDEFFSIASHELRTPLTAIRGNANMLLEYYKNDLKEDAQQMIGDIHQSSIRLTDIVNDFLDLSRIEQGKVSFAYESVVLDETVEAVVYEMKALLQEKKLSLDFNHKTLGALPRVWADKNRLKQVIYNLVGNAAKFTEKGGISIEATQQGDMIKVLVVDTGRGISSEGQQLLFHKFQQAGNSLLTRDTTRGTGLGLYISKMLIENMEGQIALESSEEGKGSTFSFTIPIASKKRIDQAAIPTALIDGRTGIATPATPLTAANLLTKSASLSSQTSKLLVVEDDPYVLRLYQRIFSNSQIQIKTAVNGKKGYDLAQEYQPDLILLDMMMPIMNGLEALTAIKEDPKTKDIPVLMLSNLGEDDVIKKATDAGASGYLIKSDFAPEQLLALVQQKLADGHKS